LVYTSVQKLEQELGNRKIIIAVENNIPLCRLDFNLMGEVLNNLLVNANLYAPDGCLIKIKASFIEDYLTIIVEDNGHGFEPDEIEKVFEKFYRSKNTKPGGTGLGLSIAKGFIEAHNGKIKLQNLHSGGAEFTIQLPVETNYLNYLKNE
jgi:two-component system sensor histidine kinase KdpD